MKEMDIIFMELQKIKTDIDKMIEEDKEILKHNREAIKGIRRVK